MDFKVRVVIATVNDSLLMEDGIGAMMPTIRYQHTITHNIAYIGVLPYPVPAQACPEIIAQTEVYESEVAGWIQEQGYTLYYPEG